jgi:hypothetical protein
MSQFTYRKRIFLTPASAHSTAYILAEVESSSDGTYKNGHYMLTLADCTRQIRLEFYLGTSRYRKQSLAKLDLLMRILGDFREALNAEAKLIEKAK